MVIRNVPVLVLLVFVIAVLCLILDGLTPLPLQAQATACTGTFTSVSQPLNDLGANEYVRLGDGPTGFTGGLYSGGTNARPETHEASGVALAQQVTPLDVIGNPDPAGKIAMISVGMSNSAAEFREFIRLAEVDPEVNPQLVIVNGAQPGQTADAWVDPNAATWQTVDSRLTEAGVTTQQVQIAWVKQTLTGAGDFPAKAQTLQTDLEVIARNLKSRYPNLKLAYYSSRTRSYTYWNGLSPEPVAFETGFAVKWMIEQQINGDADLNFDPASGPVMAPFLSWGPYLWIDGTNPRSDGLTWPQADLVQDCTHPSDSGELKVANQLLAYFKNDTTASPWFLTNTASSPDTSPEQVVITGPSIGFVNRAYNFTVTVSPATATHPLTYFWQVTSVPSAQTNISNSPNDTVTLEWGTPGLQRITVTVMNAAGALTSGRLFAINNLFDNLYLPIILK